MTTSLRPPESAISECFAAFVPENNLAGSKLAIVTRVHCEKDSVGRGVVYVLDWKETTTNASLGHQISREDLALCGRVMRSEFDLNLGLAYVKEPTLRARLKPSERILTPLFFRAAPEPGLVLVVESSTTGRVRFIFWDELLKFFPSEFVSNYSAYGEQLLREATLLLVEHIGKTRLPWDEWFKLFWEACVIYQLKNGVVNAPGQISFVMLQGSQLHSDGELVEAAAKKAWMLAKAATPQELEAAETNFKKSR